MINLILESRSHCGYLLNEKCFYPSYMCEWSKCPHVTGTHVIWWWKCNIVQKHMTIYTVTDGGISLKNGSTSCSFHFITPTFMPGPFYLLVCFLCSILSIKPIGQVFLIVLAWKTKWHCYSCPCSFNWTKWIHLTMAVWEMWSYVSKNFH